MSLSLVARILSIIRKEEADACTRFLFTLRVLIYPTCSQSAIGSIPHFLSPNATFDAQLPILIAFSPQGCGAHFDSKQLFMIKGGMDCTFFMVCSGAKCSRPSLKNNSNLSVVDRAFAGSCRLYLVLHRLHATRRMPCFPGAVKCSHPKTALPLYSRAFS